MKVPSLWTVSNYSLLNSLVRLPEYVSIAKTRGYQTIGLMDENVLYGALKLQTLAEQAGMQAIFGLTLTYFDENENEDEYALHFIAKDYLGFQELMRLSSYKMTHQSEKTKLHEFPPFSNSVALIFTFRSEFVKKTPNFDLANWLQQFDNVKNKFMGVGANMPEDWQNYVRTEPFPPFLLNEVRYLEAKDYPPYRVAKAIGDSEHLQISTLKPVGQEFLPEERNLHQQTLEAGWEEALKNAAQFVQKINVKIPTQQNLLPKFPIDKQKEVGKFLHELAFQKLPMRVENVTDQYTQRLEMELRVIDEMGFNDYFLIVWDLLDYANRSGIFTGAGRGSVAGSLVAYVLNITGVDPIKYDLLFERFLNSERYTMPDIDIDIPDNKREQILQYVAQKYGKHHVAQITTFGTLGAKQALRDVGRVLGFSISEASRWSKAVPNELNTTLEVAYAKSKRLRELVAATPRNQTLFTLAKKLEGLPRHVSTHAAGVVISDKDLFELIPLQAGGGELFLTQFTMYDIEKIGLLKMDFLGLRNLSIIADALYEIKKVWGRNLNIKQIDLRDSATLTLFRLGDTAGVFQFESAGIRRVLQKIHPDSIEDIVAVNALYRPGPMENINDFAARKLGLKQIVYPDKSLADILKKTYGIIVYQEQVMQLLQKMAGFTLGQADIVRRAIGKKKKDVIDEERCHFIEGSLKNGYTQDVAEKVYDYIEKFANYGFNRSHAFAYSFIGFEMGYLKVHFAGAFYAALLHSVRGNLKKMKEYITDARKNEISINPPDINTSEYSFRLLEKKVLRFGFSAIKGVRRDFIKEILNERKINGRFTSVDNFLLRIKHKWLKIDWLEPLVLTGVFDSLKPNRKQLGNNLESKIQNVLLSGGSMDLLGSVMKLKEVEAEDYTVEERLTYEENYLGTYFSGHPLESFNLFAKQIKATAIMDIEDRQQVKLVAMVRSLRVIKTKRGESMAFIEVSDLTGDISLTLFPKIYRKYLEELVVGKKLLIKGKVERSRYDNSLQVIVQSLKDLEIKQVSKQQTLFIRLVNEDKEMIKKLKQLLLANQGDASVIIYYEKIGERQRLSKNDKVEINEQLLKQLQAMFGERNIIVK
ncbi:MAG: DNA polymerase III subunit alpha [Streptococcaceae bacterium]|jgi:DNA polymerase-3 subunit alpha|nr:DNA polymerase III subunit alpha [Streptococcaceae bacterium]